MGQRGYRQHRKRCGYVDPRSGLRCRVQVKRAGSTYCSCAHAAAARPPGVARPEPGARARHQQARTAAKDRLQDALQLVADDQSRVPLLMAVMTALDARDEGYARGYTAGHEKKRFQGHKLRLETSRHALNEFLGGRFGKAFIMGDLRPEDLANFSFGNSRSAAAQRRFRRRRSRKS